jgi:glycosyltransferase involved in cell wall biosynthesis
MPYYSIDADVVVSIPTSDSSPASVYEAMACKTPVIISDLPWFEGKFEKDRDLLVVPVRNVEKLANAIVKILNGRSSVDIDSAYKKVFKYINYETENRKLEKFYKKILTAS